MLIYRVVLTHEAIVTVLAGCLATAAAEIREDDSIISYLPLAHGENPMHSRSFEIENLMGLVFSNQDMR